MKERYPHIIDSAEKYLSKCIEGRPSSIIQSERPRSNCLLWPKTNYIVKCPTTVTPLSPWCIKFLDIGMPSRHSNAVDASIRIVAPEHWTLKPQSNLVAVTLVSVPEHYLSLWHIQVQLGSLSWLTYILRLPQNRYSCDKIGQLSEQRGIWIIQSHRVYIEHVSK